MQFYYRAYIGAYYILDVNDALFFKTSCDKNEETSLFKHKKNS